MGGVIGGERRVRQAWEEAVGMMTAQTGMEQSSGEKTDLNYVLVVELMELADG